MEKSGRRSLYGKLFIIVVTTIVVLFVLITGVEIWLQHKVRNVIEKAQTEIAGGAYKLEIGSVSVRLIGRSVRLDNVSLKSNDSKLSSGNDSSSVPQLDVEIDQLSLNGIGVKKDGDGYMLNINSISLKYGSDQTDKSVTSDINDSHVTEHKESSYDKLSTKLKSVYAERIDIGAGHLQYKNTDGDKTVSYVLDGFKLGVDNFGIDSTTRKTFFKGDDVQASLDKLNYTFDNGAVMLETDSLQLDSKKQLLAVSSVKLLPQKYDKYQYAEKIPSHMDWTQIITGNITCFGVDYESIFAGYRIDMDSVSICKADIQSYKNHKVYQQPKVKGLFYQSLQKFPWQIDIPVVNLRDIDLIYEELTAEGEVPGKIVFNDMDLMFKNMTNIVSTDVPYMTLNAKCSFMGKAPMTAFFEFPVDSLNTHFTAKGRLGPMQLTSINGITQPLANIMIEAGHVKSLDFQMEGTSVHSDVSVKFLYNGLRVNMLKDKDGRIIRRKFLSEVVDDVVIRSENPDEMGRLHIGKGSFERDIYKSQFNYLWKSVFQGLKKSILKI